MAEEKKSLRTVVQNIRDAAQDIVSLDVVTLYGDIRIKASVKAVDGKKKIELKNLFSALQDAADVEGKLEIVAYTHIDFDKDAINYVKKGLGEEEMPLIQAHNEMVKTSQEGRLALVKAVKEMVGIGVAKATG